MKESVYIKNCRFIDCQSFKDVTFDFIEGLNVIVALNDAGKSIFTKFLKLSVNEKAYVLEEKKSLVRKFSEKAIVIYSFSDGTVSALTVYSNGKVTYHFSEKDEEGMRTSNKPFKEHLDRVAVIVDVEKNFYANILDQDQALFLVKSTPAESNSILGMYTYNEVIEKSIEFLEKEFKEYRSMYEKTSIEITKIDFLLEEIKPVNISDLRSDVNILLPLERIMSSLIDVGDILFNTEIHQDVKWDKSLINILDFAIDLVSVDLDLPNDTNILEEKSKLFNNSVQLLEIGDILLLEEDKGELLQEIDVLNICSSFLEELPSILEIELESTFEDNTVLFSSCLNVLSMSEMFEEILKTQVEKESTLNYIEELERSTKNVGESVACPIYGEIQHVEGFCIPSGHRSTSEWQKFER